MWPPFPVPAGTVAGACVVGMPPFAVVVVVGAGARVVVGPPPLP